MAVLKAIFRWTLRWTAYAVGVAFFLAVVLVGLAGFTAFGAGLVAPWIADLVSRPDRQITINNPGPLLTGKLRIASVTIADNTGVYANAENLQLDWSPLSLLGGTFHADRLFAETVSLERNPQGGEAPREANDGGFTLPVEIDLGQFVLPDVSVGATVLGQRFEIAASGRLRAGKDAIAGGLDAERKDGVGGALKADFVFSPTDDALKLDARFSEPQGGVLAGVLRLPNAPPVSIEATGEGSLSDWSGNVTADVDDARTAAVRVDHKTTGGGEHSVAVAGGGQFADLMPPFLRQAFSGETSIDLAVVYGDDGSLQIDAADIATGALLLTASGRIDRRGDNDLTASLIGVGGPVDLRWPTADGELAMTVNGTDVTARGPADSVRLSVNASLPNLQLPLGTLKDTSLSLTSDNFNLMTLSGDVAARIRTEQAEFEQEVVGRALRAPIQVEAPLAFSPQRIGFANAKIESADIQGTATGEYVPGGQSLDARIRMLATASILPEAASSRLAGMVEVSGDIRYRRPDAITISDLRIGSSAGSVSGDIGYAAGSLEATLAGQLSDLGLVVANTHGSVEISLEAAGPLDNLTGSLTAAIAEATFAGHELTDFSFDAEGSIGSQSPTATATASGRFDGQPIDLSARLQSDDGRTALPELRATVGANTLAGSLSFSRDFQPTGSLQFDFPEIALLAALAGQTLEGDLRGSVEFSDTHGPVAARIVASGSKLARGTITVDEPDVALSLAGMRTPALEGRLQAGALSAGPNRIESPVLSLHHERQSTDFGLDAGYDGAPLVAEGKISQTGDSVDVEIRRLSAAPRGISVTLARPAAITIADGNLAFAPLTIEADGGSITASGSVGDRLDVKAETQDLPAALVNRFAPALAAGGTISGSLTARGSLEQPALDYTLRWSEAAVAQTRGAGLPPLTIAASGNLANQTVSLDADVSGVAGLSVSGGGTLGLTGAKPLAMNFSGSLPFSLLAGRLSGQGLVLEGGANGDIRISGTASAPAISGAIDTSGARLIDARRNISIEGLSGRVALNGNEARVENMGGRFAGGGSVAANGSIAFADPSLPVDLTIRLDQAAYADGTMFGTTASGTLNLTGPLLAAPNLTGTVDLGETAITVPERLPPSLRQLDISHRSAPADVRRQVEQITKTETHGSSSDIGLDLRVRAPARVFVRGRGIDAELGGTLTIRGTATDPAVSGAFTLIRGRLAILTRRLDFTSGTITFGGNLIPLLDLEATTTASSATITVSVIGLANNPTVTFTSSPALPQDEILAQLIFGQSMTRLSPLQIAQLADAASQLAGGESTSLLESLRSGLGVDNLDITTDAEGNAAVSAGKYLNDRTYLELQQSGSGTGKAIINLDIGRGVKLKGEASGDGGSGAGIFYEKEY